MLEKKNCFLSKLPKTTGSDKHSKLFLNPKEADAYLLLQGIFSAIHFGEILRLSAVPKLIWLPIYRAVLLPTSIGAQKRNPHQAFTCEVYSHSATRGR